jgi:NodT family efflux transporter outer membrane factor (OMF) lipoprotein
LLAVLGGKLPAEVQPPQIQFADLTLPRALPVSLPSALVRQRPDILQAQASLHAASAEIGVATAAMLPSITLDGALGTSSTSISNLMIPSSKLWSVGAGLTQPVFHGGSLWFQRKAALDAYDAAVASYQQTVLSAFEQVADTLRALQHDADALAIDEKALATAKRALDLTQANYQAGLAVYSDVLIANAQYQQLQIVDIQARAARYQDTVALFAALGGGWWNGNSNVETRR